MAPQARPTEPQTTPDCGSEAKPHFGPAAHGRSVSCSSGVPAVRRNPRFSTGLRVSCEGKASRHPRVRGERVELQPCRDLRERTRRERIRRDRADPRGGIARLGGRVWRSGRPWRESEDWSGREDLNRPVPRPASSFPIGSLMGSLALPSSLVPDHTSEDDGPVVQPDPRL
jgi:hypothetical protein